MRLSLFGSFWIGVSTAKDYQLSIAILIACELTENSCGLYGIMTSKASSGIRGLTFEDDPTQPLNWFIDANSIS